MSRAGEAVFAQLFTRDRLLAEATRTEVATRLTGLLPSDGTTMPRLAREWQGDPRRHGEFLWSGDGGRVQAAINPICHPGDTHSVISLECPLDQVDPDEVARVLRELGERLAADFGQLTVLGPSEGVLPTMYLTPADLSRWLPEVWHALLLGAPYVELIGADRIRAAPAAVLERVGAHAFWVGLGPLSVAGTEPARRAEQRHRDAVRDHLCPDLFWRPDRRVCRTPRFVEAVRSAGPPDTAGAPSVLPRRPAPTPGTP